MSVEPKLCHQGAKKHNMVLKLTAVGSMGRPLCTLSGPFFSPASVATQPNCAHRLLFYPKKGTYPYLSYDLS